MLAIWTHISAASGKLNGVVAARNRGGNYLREYVVPIDPETTRQVNCRDAMNDLWLWWSGTMTAADRLAWEVYAREYERTGRLGVKRELPGWQAFCRQHYTRFQVNQQLGAALDPGTAPPLRPSNLAAIPYVGYDSGSNFLLYYDDSDGWPLDQDNYMAVYLSGPQPITRNFFKGPYRLAGAAIGNSEEPPLSPFTITSPTAPTSPCRIWYRVIFGSNDRERAGPFEGRIDIE